MTIKVHSTLLLTGAAGGLGQALRPRLKANCDVLRLSDRVEWAKLQPMKKWCWLTWPTPRR
jgi:nucleoside-diphosphate-sugar epimerase